MRRATEEINSRAQSGPPDGVPAGFTMLIDPDQGQTLGISFFETEEDRRKGDETLSSMSPPDDGFGKRVSLEMYEVAIDVRV